MTFKKMKGHSSDNSYPEDHLLHVLFLLLNCKLVYSLPLPTVFKLRKSNDMIHSVCRLYYHHKPPFRGLWEFAMHSCRNETNFHLLDLPIPPPLSLLLKVVHYLFILLPIYNLYDMIDQP